MGQKSTGKSADGAGDKQSLNFKPIDVDAGYSKIINNSTVKAFILGGSGGSAVQSVNGVEGVVNFITTGGDYSKDSPGAALSYKLRYLKDNSIANIILSTEYNVRKCERVFSHYKIILSRIYCENCDDAGSEAEIYGYLKVALPDGSLSENLWNVGESSAWRVIPDIAGTLWINTSTDFTLENASATSYITVSGHLYEDNTWIVGDDDIGSSTKKVYLVDFYSDIVLGFNGDGNIAQAVFYVVPMDYK